MSIVISKTVDFFKHKRLDAGILSKTQTAGGTQ